MSVYYTVNGETDVQFIQKRSKFISHIKHVDSENMAIDFINEIRSKYWDAKHNVYAYSIRDQNYKKYSDDGEPQGTAGLPILNILNNKCITDAVIVITRYFGGILLGKGGLVRAYSMGAELAIESCKIIKMTLCVSCVLTIPYNVYGRVESILLKNGIPYTPEFSQEVILDCYIPEGKFNNIKKSLLDLSFGKVNIEINGKAYKPTYDV